MKLEDYYFWMDIQDAIDRKYPQIGGYILDFSEMDECQGYQLTCRNGKITIKAFGVNEPSRHDTTFLTENECNYRCKSLSYIDPPGTFEGISLDADT